MLIIVGNLLELLAYSAGGTKGFSLPTASAESAHENATSEVNLDVPQTPVSSGHEAMAYGDLNERIN